MIGHLLELMPFANAAFAVAMGYKNRRHLKATWKATPTAWKLIVVGLLIAGAVIPGPVDDLIIAAVLVRIARRSRVLSPTYS